MLNSRVIISGSLAFDSIMVFEGHFKDHILPDKVHMLNVAFLVPQLKREFGGTAANIAYGLKLLGGDPAILASVGKDGAEYLERLKSFGINTSYIHTFADQFTAQAFITTDMGDNQITAFHPGAMNQAHQVTVPSALPASWGTVSPNGKQAMMEHAQQYHAAGLPYLLDPGQGLPMFNGEELRSMLSNATALAVNDYEAQMFAKTIGVSEDQLALQVPNLVITRGAEGVSIFNHGKAIDPTGCGDAFRAGLLFGLSSQWDWIKSAQLGAVMGAIKIEHQGPQNYAPTRQAIFTRAASAFGGKWPDAA